LRDRILGAGVEFDPLGEENAGGFGAWPLGKSLAAVGTGSSTVLTVSGGSLSNMLSGL